MDRGLAVGGSADDQQAEPVFEAERFERCFSAKLFI